MTEDCKKCAGVGWYNKPSRPPTQPHSNSIRQAAMRKADKRRGSQALNEQKAKAEAELKAQHDAQRAKMAARRAMFEGK